MGGILFREIYCYGRNPVSGGILFERNPISRGVPLEESLGFLESNPGRRSLLGGILLGRSSKAILNRIMYLIFDIFRPTSLGNTRFFFIAKGT